MHREIQIKQFPIVTTHWWPKTRNERFVWENQQYLYRFLPLVHNHVQVIWVRTHPVCDVCVCVTCVCVCDVCVCVCVCDVCVCVWRVCVCVTCVCVCDVCVCVTCVCVCDVCVCVWRVCVCDVCVCVWRVCVCVCVCDVCVWRVCVCVTCVCVWCVCVCVCVTCVCDVCVSCVCARSGSHCIHTGRRRQRLTEGVSEAWCWGNCHRSCRFWTVYSRIMMTFKQTRLLSSLYLYTSAPCIRFIHLEPGTVYWDMTPPRKKKKESYYDEGLVHE